MSKLKCFIFIFLCLYFTNCIIENEDIVISLNNLSSKIIGKKGTIIIESNQANLFKIDTSRKIYFQSKISDKYDVDCGFWKDSDDKMYVFCNLDTNIPEGAHYITFQGIPKFTYQNYGITISDSKFDFQKSDKDIIDLYSEQQTIDIKDDEDSYELKFNIVAYNQEEVFLGDMKMNCKQNDNKLFCQISKSDLEKDLYRNEVTMKVCFINENDNNLLAEFFLVGKILIKDYVDQKTDVFIGITKLVENVAEGESNIAYETNVTNLNKVSTSIDFLQLNFVNDNGDTSSCECSLKKYDNYPLYITCFMRLDGKNRLKEIESEINILNANIRYNFRIQPVKNEEIIDFNRNGEGSWIYRVFPYALNFTKKDTLYIDLYSEGISNLKGITLNQNKGELSCQNQNRFLRCTVPKSHFEGAKDKYYFIKHNNHLNSKSTYYEISPIEIILNSSGPDSKGNILSISSFYYSLLLILIML